MAELAKPYWACPTSELPTFDFNREIIDPGKLPLFPDGAIGIRTDDDFWAVAALPFAQYCDVPIERIVAEFWPDILEEAEFNADSTHPMTITTAEGELK